MNASTLRERIRSDIRFTKVCGGRRGFARKKEKSKTYRVTGVAENNKIWNNRKEDKARPHSLCVQSDGGRGRGCTSDVPVPINNRISRAGQSGHVTLLPCPHSSPIFTLGYN